MTTPLQIEERDLGGGLVEGYYTEDPRPAYLALQSDLPNATIQARVIEGHGLYRRPPRSGRKVLVMQDTLDRVDEGAIRAMRPVVEDLVPEYDIECIKRAFRAAPFKDAYWIAWDCEMHPHTVIAILRNLEERGELPGA